MFMRENLLNRFKHGTMEPRELQSIIKLAIILNQQLHKWWRMLNFCSFCVYLWLVPDDSSRAYFLLQVPSNPNTAEWSLLNVILPTKDSAGRLIGWDGKSQIQHPNRSLTVITQLHITVTGVGNT